jgi:hypothetical protein
MACLTLPNYDDWHPQLTGKTACINGQGTLNSPTIHAWLDWLPGLGRRREPHELICVITYFLFRRVDAFVTAIVYAIVSCWLILWKAWYATVVLHWLGMSRILRNCFRGVQDPSLCTLKIMNGLKTVEVVVCELAHRRVKFLTKICIVSGFVFYSWMTCRRRQTQNSLRWIILVESSCTSQIVRHLLGKYVGITLIWENPSAPAIMQIPYEDVCLPIPSAGNSWGNILRLHHILFSRRGILRLHGNFNRFINLGRHSSKLPPLPK